MPVIGAITGGLDFSNYYLPMSSKVQHGLAYADAKKQGAVLGYGQFFTVAINFIIIAFILFMIIRLVNRVHAPKPVAPPEQTLLLREIWIGFPARSRHPDRR